MLAGQGDYIIFADADLATPPDQLPLLTEALADHDIALGSRVQPDGSDRRSTASRSIGACSAASSTRSPASGSPAPCRTRSAASRASRARSAHDLFARQRIGSIVFDAEIIHLARKRGYTMAIVPVQWSDKRGSRMRVRPGLALRVVYDLFRIPLIHRERAQEVTGARVVAVTRSISNC